MEKKGFDAFASDVFTPVYFSYAQRILERTGVRSGKLLDVGCGGGMLGFALMDFGDFDEVTFFDKQEKMLDHARARAEACAFTASELKYVQGDACDLSCFEENTFDLVVSRGSMQFWDDVPTALREFHRVLKQGGHCYIGGGVGVTDRQTDRMDELMARHAAEYGVGHGSDPRSHDDSEARKAMRTEQCKEFAGLFDELNCSYMLINSKSEGGWFVFRKDDELAVW